ncbi:GSCOCG00002817001-RA-CDS [Cotesia congregata]|nr:GSCOCG00002817001-RA-CDS [Cotesia congregata]
MYSWASNLRKHLKMGCSMLTQDTHFSCRYCPYRSRIQASFFKHLLSVHNIKYLFFYNCKLAVFLTKDFISSIQPKKASKAPRASKRKIKKSNYEFTCSACKKTFPTSANLRDHIRRRANNKKMECCPFCDYTSDRRWNVKSHIKRIHTTS